MALRLSGLFHTNVSDMQKGEGASSAKIENTHGQEHHSEPAVRELTPGQTIRGEIVEKNGQEIQIRVGKDQILHAKMEQDIQASKGQSVTFEVRSSSSGVISLRPLFQNMSQENNAVKALVWAGIECDAKNMQMVSAMMQEGMSIGRENLREMYKMLMDIPDADIEHAVQLSRLQLPATPENLEQLTAYKNYEHQLLSAFSEIAEEIPEAVLKLFSEGKPKEGAELIQKLLTVFAENEGLGAGEENGRAASDAALDKGLQDIALSEKQPEEADGTDGIKTVYGAAGEESKAYGAGTEMAAADEAVHEEMAAAGKESEKSSMEAAPFADKVTLSDGEDVSVRTAEKWESGTAAADGAKNEPLPVSDRAQLAELAKNAGAGDETVLQIQNGQLGKEELYQLVRTLAERADTPEKQHAVKELFVSGGFQKLLKEAISEQWTLRMPEQLEKEAVSKLYERLEEQTRQITRALSQSVRADSPLFKSVQNLRENVDFLNQLNQMYTYVQLPLKMGRSRAHGDLYVYTNKKNLAKKDGNVSAFLHLDMEHLGMVDVYVAMEQNRISTNFYLEEEESLALLEKNMDMLTSHLTEKGYQAECRVQVREQAGNAMEELLASDKNISIISEQSFDVRA